MVKNPIYVYLKLTRVDPIKKKNLQNHQKKKFLLLPEKIEPFGFAIGCNFSFLIISRTGKIKLRPYLLHPSENLSFLLQQQCSFFAFFYWSTGSQKHKCGKHKKVQESHQSLTYCWEKTTFSFLHSLFPQYQHKLISPPPLILSLFV